MRLDKLLSNEGFGSRKEVKQYIKEGVVLINGRPAKNGNQHIDPEHDEVTLDGIPVDYEPFIYVVLNKPAGVISATEDNEDETVIDLVPEFLHLEPFPVGRLDKDTTGLLLITNDGKWSHQLTNPKKGIEKEYHARVVGPLDEDAAAQFAKGITLEDGDQCLPAELEIDSYDKVSGEYEVKVMIQEGKYHQVKRMIAAVGGRVLDLHRHRIGNFVLPDNLEEGMYRRLSDDEKESLFEKN